MYSLPQAIGSGQGNMWSCMAFLLEGSGSQWPSSKRQRQKELFKRMIRPKSVWWCWLAATIFVKFVVLLEGGLIADYYTYPWCDNWQPEKMTGITGEQLEEFVMGETLSYIRAKSESQFELVTYKKAESGTSVEVVKQTMDMWYGRKEFGSNHVLFLISCKLGGVEEGDKATDFRKRVVMTYVNAVLIQMRQLGKIDESKWLIGGVVNLESVDVFRELGLSTGVLISFGLSITAGYKLTLDPSTLEQGTVDTDYQEINGWRKEWVAIENEDVILRLMQAARQMLMNPTSLENSEQKLPEAHWIFDEPSTHIIHTTKNLCLHIIYWDQPDSKLEGPVLDLVYIKSMALIDSLEKFLITKLQEFKQTHSHPNLQISSRLVSTHRLPEHNKKYKLEVALVLE